MLKLLGILSMVLVVWFTWYQYTRVYTGTGQSRRESVIEAWVNIVIGFSINFTMNIWLLPLMSGVPVSHEANFWGGWIYTSISIIRQFAVRRWFNNSIQAFSHRLANLCR